MKNRLAFLPFLCSALLLAGLYAPAALAQVSTNLEALPAAPAHAGHGEGRHGRNASSHRRAVYAPPLQDRPASPGPLPAPTPPGYTRVPSIPAKAPRPVSINPPVFPVILHPAVPAAIVTASTGSHSHTESLRDNGLRIIFDTNSTEMNEASIEAVRHYGQTIAPQTGIRLVLRSYATLPGNDISMPRRLALSRALNIRSLLVQSGIATTRIYPVAQGRPEGTDPAPADRLDIALQSNPAPSDSFEKGTKAP